MTTKILADFTAHLKYSDLSPATVRKTKQCILDWLGVGIRGSREKPAQILRKVILTAKEDEASVLSGEGLTVNALNAAFCNGANSHTLDFDDLHNPSIIHIATVVIPPAFAVAEKEHKSGKDVLTAVVAGYEVCARVGEAVIPESYYFWHTTGTVGAIGAGTAAAKVLGLNAEQTLHCLGSAGTQAAGLWEFVKEGAMSKPLHTGKSSYAGVLSAYLAREGFTGATKILEGEKGFCRAMVKVPHLEKLTEGLGLGFKIDDNSFKPYPCCKHSHASIYALQVLQKENKFMTGDVAKVEVLVNSITDSLINNPDPQTAYGCKFSIQYCDASVLKYGNVGIEQFSAQAMADQETRALMQKISVHQDPEIQQVYDTDPSKLATKVIVTLKDGRKLEKEVDYPKGDPDCPMTWEDSVAKFTALAEPVYGKEKTAKLCALIDKLDEVEDFKTALRACL